MKSRSPAGPEHPDPAPSVPAAEPAPHGEPAQPVEPSQAVDVAELGYRGPTACAAAGITYRQLDYWARTALVVPSVRAATGSGTQRLYSFRDILVLRVVKKLLDAGVSLQNIRAAVAALRSRGVTDLSEITLISDGSRVYECRSADEVVDLLQGGQGVFGIAVGATVRDVRGQLERLPAEPGPVAAGHPARQSAAGTDGGQVHHPGDELARRRSRRSSA